MTLLPYSYKKVTEDTRVRVSNHFFYTDFGVRDRLYGMRYVCAGSPGTGFFERETESQSYHEFVSTHLAARHATYLDLLLGREPNFDRELARATAALKSEDDADKLRILESYSNALAVGRQEERLQRYIRGVKDKMGHRSTKRYVSLISHFKRRIQQLDKDMRGVQLNVTEGLPTQVKQAYQHMVQAFVEMSERCRRVWSYRDEERGIFRQVFFDLGIFDYIRSEYGLPLMRDAKGVAYYILPDKLLVARSNTDFDLIPLKGLTVVVQEMSIQEPTQLLSDKMIDAACMLQIPALGLTFYFNHAHVVVDFVRALDELKNTL